MEFKKCVNLDLVDSNSAAKICVPSFQLFKILFLFNFKACSSADISSMEFDFGYDSPNEIEANFNGVIAEFQMENTLSVDSKRNTNIQ